MAGTEGSRRRECFCLAGGRRQMYMHKNPGRGGLLNTPTPPFAWQHWAAECQYSIVLVPTSSAHGLAAAAAASATGR